MFSGKKILIGISASISAYKIYTLIRELVEKGAEVRVVITPSAKSFVSPTILSTFSGHKVYCEFVEDELWQNHVHLGQWAHLLIIAPASCNTIAKLANGICDNLLVATYLSAVCKTVILPAMDEDMWNHPSTQRNISLLEQAGNLIMEPASGLLASGLTGKGRLPETEQILSYVAENCFRENTLAEQTILITAGPTEEPIDPVRLITNRSSGKMGYAIAEALYMLGANIILITGPVSIQTNYKGINVIKVNTAADMFEACLVYQNTYTIAIFSAAVADYKLLETNDQKIKKTSDQIQLDLIKTNDILAFFGHAKKNQQKVIGFALETEHATENALDKLNKKNADLMVLNHLSIHNKCFDQSAMTVSFVEKNQNFVHFDVLPKEQIAQNLANYITQNWIS